MGDAGGGRGRAGAHPKMLVEAVRLGLGAALRLDHLVVVQLGQPGPRLLRGSAKHLEDLVDLLELVLPGQDRPLQEQLGEDAADGPHVHRRAVVLRAQQQLRRAVPERDHPVGQLAARVVKWPRQAEIRQLQLPLVVDQEVGACRRKGKAWRRGAACLLPPLQVANLPPPKPPPGRAPLMSRCSTRFLWQYASPSSSCFM